jgi:hypothetical protein
LASSSSRAAAAAAVEEVVEVEVVGWLLPLELALRWAVSDGFEVIDCADFDAADDDDVSAANFADRR